MALAVAQSTSGSGSGTGLTTSKSLSGAPTAGNLLIAFIGTGNSSTTATITIDTTKWTPFERAINPNDTDMTITACYRYVQIGDTAAMPAFCTAGSTFFAYTVQEISGVNGTWANDYQSSRYVQARSATSMTTPTDITRSANCLGLLGFFKYNRSANSGLDAAWTSDQNANNSGNYGSYGCAHQAVVSAGTTISATNTFQAGADTTGMIQVILQTAVYTHPYVVRYRYMDSGSSGHPGTVQFGGAPLAGHSLVAFLSWLDGSATDPTIGGSWTQWESVTQGTGHQMFGLARDVSGDTDVLAAISTAGATFWALYVVEVGGMTGVFNTDKLQSLKGAESSAATVTTSTDTTTGANQMVLTAFSEYNSSTLLAQTGADYLVAPNIANSTDYGGAALAFTFKASGASSVSSVWTKGTSAHKTAYIQLRMGSGASTETATGVMTFGGIAFRAGAARTETATAGMAFGGIKFAASGTDRHTGVGALAFSGITIKANASDLGKGPSSSLPATIQNNQLQPTTWNVPIVDKNTGFPSPEFQRKWQKQFAILEAQAQVNAAVVPQSYIDSRITAAILAAEQYADTLVGSHIAAGGATGNPLIKNSNTDYDTTWESNAVFGSIGLTLGAAGAGYSLAVQGEAGTVITATRYSSNANGPQFSARKARGTIASPSAVVLNDVVFQQIGMGYGATGFQNATNILGRVIEPTPSDTAMGGQLAFFLSPLGSATTSEVARFEFGTGFSMFGANPVIDQNRTHILNSSTVAGLPTVVTGGLRYVTDLNGGRGVVYGGPSLWRDINDSQVAQNTIDGSGVLSNFTGHCSFAYRAIVNNTMQKLSDAGLLAKLAAFGFTAVPTNSIDACLNWATPGTNNLTITGSPTWAANQGFTGDGTSALLSTVATLTTFGATQNNVSVGCFVRTAATGSAKAVIGSANAVTRRMYMQSFTSGALTVRCNDQTAGDTFTPGQYTGLFVMSRSVSTGFNCSVNDAAASTVTRASVAPNSIVSFLGTADSTGSEFSNAQVSFWFIGNQALTATDIANLRWIVVDYYLVQVGAVAADYTVAALPLATTPPKGTRLNITDGAASPVFGAVPTGGGSLYLPVMTDSAAWHYG